MEKINLVDGATAQPLSVAVRGLNRILVQSGQVEGGTERPCDGEHLFESIQAVTDARLGNLDTFSVGMFRHGPFFDDQLERIVFRRPRIDSQLNPARYGAHPVNHVREIHTRCHRSLKSWMH